MIEIKKAEIEILEQLCDPDAQTKALLDGWKSAADDDHISLEAFTLLMNQPCEESLVKTTISIGANAAYRQIETKKKRSATQKKAQVEATGALPGDKKALAEFIKEIGKRQQQSRKDKQAKPKSGKGQRGAGPSKTKNQTKNTAKVSKRRQGSDKKRGASSKKQ
ncbi:hypothetical protein BDV95DRAFT_609127 [Massariosphaeria phaeospora]|uniref:Uncharacterized protein n=1 Tax=Massariosphaeria phaeospora TaxID=100035 RepID=A0A7C8IAZ7_9PLEO|nr:hypothetical protein BDV95DRAFT_609127 [Massariosphaeria phaeospora]